MPRTLLLPLLLLPLSLVVGAEGDVLEKDLWYVGDLNGQPAATLHAVVVRQPDGRRISQFDTSIVLSRTLGAQAIRMEMSESQRSTEDAQGRIIDFRIDQDQNGSRTSATGVVEGDHVRGTVLRLGRTTTTSLAITAAAPLRGQQGSQDVLVQAPPAVGASTASATPALLNNQLVLITTTATRLADAASGEFAYSLATGLIPPVVATLDHQGDVVSMHMDLAILTLDFHRTPGPVALLGADLAATGLAKAAGPAPRMGPVNRFRLTAAAAAALPSDAFQEAADGVVTVHAVAEPAVLADPAPLLQAEAQYEIDDPGLRAWVKTAVDAAPAKDQAELAERLRLLVRSHITQKDLSKADGSALETFRDRRGDCTEHANLLTATLRIAGIPARTEVGVVYAPTFGGWVGHAWNSAWCDGHWVHLDSAYPGIPRSCYLRMATTSGADAKGTAMAMMQAFSALGGSTVEYLPE
jgi:hypothetical protein